jgi:hypothetical protein
VKLSDWRTPATAVSRGYLSDCSYRIHAGICPEFCEAVVDPKKYEGFDFHPELTRVFVGKGPALEDAKYAEAFRRMARSVRHENLGHSEVNINK